METATGITRIAVNDIEVNPKQPRRDFDEQALNELAESIKMHDIIQPVTVSKLANGKYRLISGERRWRARKKWRD
ncbi:MAG: ParB/RepB/Spo0J family partition protein [Chitinophagaceae bacterium]|nr:ParB/RepB/Spo0J family partition protein [Chitinophagaceae bacterium]